MNKVEAALQKATGVKPRGDRQAYLDKLVEAVSNLESEDWSKLSKEAQDWFNRNVKLYNNEKSIPDFSDSKADAAVEAEAEEAEQVDEADEAEEAAPAKKKKSAKPSKQPSHEKEQNMAKTAKKKVASKSAAKKSAKPAKPVRAAANGGEGARPLMIRMLIKNPKMTTKELVEKIKAKGSNASELSVSAMKSQYKQMLGLLIEQGMVKASLLPSKAS